MKTIITEERTREIHEMIWEEVVEKLKTENDINLMFVKEEIIEKIYDIGRINDDEYNSLMENSCCALCMYDGELSKQCEVWDLCKYCVSKGFSSDTTTCLDGMYSKVYFGLCNREERISYAEKIRDLYKELEK